MACHVAWDWSQASRFDCPKIDFDKMNTNKIKEIKYKPNSKPAELLLAKLIKTQPIKPKYQPAKPMQVLRAEQNDAVRKYYAAFPALTSPPTPPRAPAWVRPAMQPPARKPRRTRRRTRDPPPVPDRDDLDLPSSWTLDDDPRAPEIDDSEFARFRAKFDSGIEALWATADTPEDDYRDLPIDLHELLSSPSDFAYADAAPEGVWATDGPDAWPGVDALRDRLRPLKLVDEAFAPVLSDPESLPVGLFKAETFTRWSLSTLNHDEECSAFVKVVRGSVPRYPPPPPRSARLIAPPLIPGENLLTSIRTHFRPIKGEEETESGCAQHADGATFDTGGSPTAVEWRRSANGGCYVSGSPRRYLEVRLSGGCLRFPAVRADVSVQTEPRTDRKRRHSAALRRCCGLPHAPFLQCCPQDRPLTR